MDINNILASIPSIIGSLYDSIYCVSKELDKCYRVQYTGSELKITSPTPYEEFTNKLSVFKDNIIKEIEEKDLIKKVSLTKDNKEKIINSITKDKYKLVFISDITNYKEKDENKKILLIADDSPVITKFFTKTFEDEYEILVAHNGEEAINLVNEYLDKPLLGAFIDLQMPVKTGYDVLEYFKQNNLFSQVPVSVISGEDTADGIERATAYGIVDMLQKPFNADAAKSIVNKTISFSPKK